MNLSNRVQCFILRRIKEQKEKMREAKLRALAGEEEPEEAPPINNGPSSDDEGDA